jgi:hypothetical protein
MVSVASYKIQTAIKGKVNFFNSLGTLLIKNVFKFVTQITANE